MVVYVCADVWLLEKYYFISKSKNRLLKIKIDHSFVVGQVKFLSAGLGQ